MTKDEWRNFEISESEAELLREALAALSDRLTPQEGRLIRPQIDGLDFRLRKFLDGER